MRFEFGDFVVDDGTRQLTRSGAVVPIAPKAFDLLITLISERPRVLPKEDLHARLWPKTFVSDASLATVVTELRAALGERASHAVFVRTVHRHGYAFQGGARELPSGDPERETPAERAPEAAMDYWLVTAAHDVALLSGDNIVGRDPKARVWLDAPSVSRHHARIRIQGGDVSLVDLGSKNGTHVGESRVTGVTRLHDGDIVRFGSISVTFRAWAAEPTRTDGGAC